MGQYVRAYVGYGFFVEESGDVYWNLIDDSQHLEETEVSYEFANDHGRFVYVKDPMFTSAEIDDNSHVPIPEVLPSISKDALEEIESASEKLGAEDPQWQLFWRKL